jgi:hypothetical protein
MSVTWDIGMSPRLKKEAHCCLEERGRLLILIYLGKRKEKLKIGGKRVPRLNA